MKLSQRTIHVLRVVEEVKRTAFDLLDREPDNFTDKDLEKIIISTYAEVARKHNVTESSIRDACVRKSSLGSTAEFAALLRQHLFGKLDLVKQLVATCKTNETPDNISKAFQNM